MIAVACSHTHTRTGKNPSAFISNLHHQEQQSSSSTVILPENSKFSIQHERKIMYAHFVFDRSKNHLSNSIQIKSHLHRASARTQRVIIKWTHIMWCRCTPNTIQPYSTYMNLFWLLHDQLHISIAEKTKWKKRRILVLFQFRFSYSSCCCANFCAYARKLNANKCQKSISAGWNWNLLKNSTNEMQKLMAFWQKKNLQLNCLHRDWLYILCSEYCTFAFAFHTPRFYHIQISIIISPFLLHQIGSHRNICILLFGILWQHNWFACSCILCRFHLSQNEWIMRKIMKKIRFKV